MTDFSFEAEIIKETICAEAAMVRDKLTRPHVLYKPSLFPDGTKWCALYGDDLQVGVAGFGDTPAEAMDAFDDAWINGLTPTAQRQANAVREEEEREEQFNNGPFGVGA